MSVGSGSVPPIFLVGAPRSGTTLLAAIFASHRDYACGPETQFFPQLNDQVLARLVADPAWPSEAVRRLQDLTLSDTSVPELYGITEEQLAEYLVGRAASVQALLEALTATFAARKGKPGWVEKTPNHLLHLDRIRRLYPDSPIVRIVRDPRDSALSTCRLPWSSDSFIANCHLWNAWYRKSRTFFERDPHSYTVRYEDLVEDPNTTLVSLCDAIGLQFQQGMLEHQSAAASVITAGEPWKQSVCTPINSARIAAWRKELSPAMAHAGSLICYQAIGEFGYPDAVVPCHELAYVDFGEQYIEQHEEELVQAAESNILIRAAQVDDEIPATVTRLTVAGSTSVGRLAAAATFIWRVRAARKEGRPIPYLRNLDAPGISERLCHKALRRWGCEVSISVAPAHKHRWASVAKDGQPKGSASRVRCRLCGGSTRELFTKIVLGKYDVGFHECQVCKSLQTEEPYWLSESYADGLRLLDTGAVERAQALQRVVYMVAKLHRLPSDTKVLDWGAGDGLMVRMFRDVGLDAYHWDPFTRNTYAAGFDGDPGQRYGLVTAFEVWEHLPDPAVELRRIFAAQPDIHLATTCLYMRQDQDWPYLNVLTGRHVFFYSREAIKMIAQQYGYGVSIYQNSLLVFHRTSPLKGWRAVAERKLFADRHSRRIAFLFATMKMHGLQTQDREMLAARLSAMLQNKGKSDSDED
jgi:hypothetical protein